MEKNIFEGAKFGDKFVTRDGRVAIYHGYFHDFHCLNVDGVVSHIKCWENGKSCYIAGGADINWSDIVSRYQEPIDEDKLDKLANENGRNYANNVGCGVSAMTYAYGFKDGYRKAKEE